MVIPQLDPDRDEPLFTQLYEALRRRIVTGELRPGARLPTTRQLAKDLGTSRTVAVQAYELLTEEGYISGHVGRGTFVCSELPEERVSGTAMQRVWEPEEIAHPVLSLAAKRAMELEPLRAPEAGRSTASASIRFTLGALPSDDAWLERWRPRVRQWEGQEDEGGASVASPRLLGVLVEHLRKTRGIACEPEQILIVPSRRAALDLVIRTLVDPGGEVVLEDPGDPAVRRAFLAAGAELVPVPVGAEGLRWSEGSEWSSAGGRLIHLTPSCQYPTGTVMPEARRRRLLVWAREQEAFIVEDDRDGDLRHTGPLLAAVHALDGEWRTIYVGALDRFRLDRYQLAFAVLPPEIVGPATVLQQLADDLVPAGVQRVLGKLVALGHYEAAVRRLIQMLATRREALLESLRGQLGDSIVVGDTMAGTHVVAWMPDLPAAAEQTLVDRARVLGVEVTPLAGFSHRSSGSAGVVLGYGGLSETEIREGVRRLADAWRVTSFEHGLRRTNSA